ncbi:MAG TPA: hypothetical protein PKD96_03215 [Candidatus Absconditabacterales bacterium]|nr:hypothetical protein [Candidatus Absconditabacterales bacterium]
MVALKAKHPFETQIRKSNLQRVFSNYLAMSQAFPYLQAGSQKELIMDCIMKNKDVPVEIEITSVVGNFLCWDETGGHFVVGREGNAGLSKILDVEKYYHSHLLKTDIKYLMNHEINPDYSLVTQAYLKKLYEGLSSKNHVNRCACMVAFEQHAGVMIQSLWDSLTKLFDIPKERLIYFAVHVGGDDPAEIYHEEMTHQMIQKIVSPDQVNDWLIYFEGWYEKNLQWCDDICS